MGAQLLIGARQIIEIQTGTQGRVGAILLNPCQGPLTSIIDRRDTRHSKQQGVNVIDMLQITQRAGQPVDVVVVYKVIGIDIPVNPAGTKLPV